MCVLDALIFLVLDCVCSLLSFTIDCVLGYIGGLLRTVAIFVMIVLSLTFMCTYAAFKFATMDTQHLHRHTEDFFAALHGDY